MPSEPPPLQPFSTMNCSNKWELFRHRVLRLLKHRQLLSQERIELLLSWRRSGFSIDDSVRLLAGDQKGLENVARYMLRAPVSLSRMRWNRSDKEVFYFANPTHHRPQDPSLDGQLIDRLEFLARVIAQLPEPRKHLMFYYGQYAHRVRARRLKSHTQSQEPEKTGPSPQDDPAVSPARKAALRRRWAHLIQRVFDVDPLVCEHCGGKFRVVAFITEPRVIRRILEHLRIRDFHNRAPPPEQPTSPSV
jgi:hypothetical protein